jgi:dTDP-4-dehydrorhamnose reductase
MTTLILGRNGQLGWTLERRAQALGPVVALGRAELDLADAGAVASAVASIRPSVVLNAAAYTAVDRAEADRDAAYAINASAPEALAAACAAHGALLVHWSTDYVFDGTKAGRYLESDTTAPINVYGASKLAGEQAILASDCAAVVLRTSWVYGEHGGNFAKTMLRLATERDALRVVADQHGTPTRTDRLAEAALAIVSRARASGDAEGWLRERRGVYHASAAGATTWAEYARCVIGTAARLPAFEGRLKVTADRVEPIPASAYPTPAARPANSLLDCGALAATFGFTMPDWQDDVVEFVGRIGAG